MTVLLYKGGRRYAVQQISVAKDGSVALDPEISLPDRWDYSGPVATSQDSCVVIGDNDTEREVIAYQWRLGDKQVVQIGSLSRSHYYGWGLQATSYSCISGHALVAAHAPEGLLDPSWVWVPGTERWQKLVEAHPGLEGIADRLLTTAAFSPDGSLLAVAAQRGGPCDPSGPADIFVYRLGDKQVQRFSLPRQYVWSLALSPDNLQLCWTDTGYPSGLAEFELSGASVELDDLGGAGLGLLSLETGKARYWRLAEQKDLRRILGSEERVLAPSCAFSLDGTHIHLGAGALVSFDPVSIKWHQVVGDCAGFAVMPVGHP